MSSSRNDCKVRLFFAKVRADELCRNSKNDEINPLKPHWATPKEVCDKASMEVLNILYECEKKGDGRNQPR